MKIRRQEGIRNGRWREAKGVGHEGGRRRKENQAGSLRETMLGGTVCSGRPMAMAAHGMKWAVEQLKEANQKINDGKEDESDRVLGMEVWFSCFRFSLFFFVTNHYHYSTSTYVFSCRLRT